MVAICHASAHRLFTLGKPRTWRLKEEFLERSGIGKKNRSWKEGGKNPGWRKGPEVEGDTCRQMPGEAQRPC